MRSFFKFFIPCQEAGARGRQPAKRRPLHGLPRLLFAGLLLTWVSAAGAGESGRYPGFQAEGDIRRFAGETLYFDISFLLFHQAATAEVHFFEKDGVYRARLVAQTKGFIGLLTSYRQHIYETTFEVIDGGRRLRATSFLRQVTNGNRHERTEHTFDYARRWHHWTLYVNGEATENDKEPIPQGVSFDDVLTAFYNFRNSVYGPVTPGVKYSIHTVPEMGHDTIEVDVHTEAEAERERQAIGRSAEGELLIDIIVPKKIFNTETGRIRLWSSPHLIPVESIIEDYILLGDLHANFSRREMKKTGNPPPAVTSQGEGNAPG